MWRGRTPALVAYGLAMARVWQERGFADTTERQIGEFAPEVVGPVAGRAGRRRAAARRGWATRRCTGRTAPT